MPFIESAIGEIASSVVEGAIALGKHATTEIKGQYSEVDHINRLLAASSAYIDNYLNRRCQIKIMPGLMKPLKLLIAQFGADAVAIKTGAISLCRPARRHGRRLKRSGHAKKWMSDRSTPSGHSSATK